MKNSELVAELSKRTELSQQNVRDLLAALGEVVGTCLTNNDSVYFHNFGAFETKKKAERVSVNPANGKRYLVPPKITPVFKPGTTLKEKLKDLPVSNG